jgi:hypothetical protein
MWSAVLSFVLGLVGMAPAAIGSQPVSETMGPEASAIFRDQLKQEMILLAEAAPGSMTVQPQQARRWRILQQGDLQVNPADVKSAPKDLMISPAVRSGIAPSPFKFPLAGPWHPTDDGGFGQALQDQTLVLYMDGTAKLFDKDGILLGSKLDPIQAEIFRALQKSRAMTQPQQAAKANLAPPPGGRAQ